MIRDKWVRGYSVSVCERIFTIRGNNGVAVHIGHHISGILQKHVGLFWNKQQIIIAHMYRRGTAPMESAAAPSRVSPMTDHANLRVYSTVLVTTITLFMLFWSENVKIGDPKMGATVWL